MLERYTPNNVLEDLCDIPGFDQKWREIKKTKSIVRIRDKLIEAEELNRRVNPRGPTVFEMLAGGFRHYFRQGAVRMEDTDIFQHYSAYLMQYIDMDPQNV